MPPLSPSLMGAQIDTLAELYQQELPQLLRQSENASLAIGITRVYAVGNGDSYHAILSAKAAFAGWTTVEYIPMPAYTFFTKEMEFMGCARAKETLVVCVSASGSSKLAVNILNSVKERGIAHTLSITGCPNCAMDQCAEMKLSCAISEKGRTPGIRTYAASLCGLFCLAARLSGKPQLLEELAKQLETSASVMPDLLFNAKKLADTAVTWDWPHAMVLGCGGLMGCAQFICAKFAEGCGVFSTAVELEEWCHVESMTYPLNAPILLLMGSKAERQQIGKVADVARRAGHPVVLFGASLDEEIKEAVSLSQSFDIICAEELYPLYYYIPGVLLSQALAEKLSRSMFLSDLPISLF